MTTARMRSFLYVPASNQRALEKVRGLVCDGVILDLEDAVAPTAKADARQNLRQFFSLPLGEKTVLIRINHPAAAYYADDCALVRELKPHGIAIPKVNGVTDLATLPELPLWPLIESPQGVLNVEAIAAHARVAGLILGTNDLAKDLKVALAPERTALLYALSRCVLAARAFGRAVLDGVHTDLEDMQGYAAACAQGRALGFDGKTLIHPKQIDAANQAFAPSADDVAWAQRVVEAWAQEGHKGVIALDGQMIEALHVTQAQAVLAMAAQLKGM